MGRRNASPVLSLDFLGLPSYPVVVKIVKETDMKKYEFRGMALVLAAAILVLAVGTMLWSQEPYTVDKTVPLPKTGQADLKFEAGPVIFDEVIIRNMPDEEDLAKAKNNPSDKCHPKLQVGVSNKGTAKMKFHLKVRLEDKDGNVYMSCDRNDTAEPGAVNDHTNLCWLDSMKTLDWPKVTAVHIIAKVTKD